MFFENAKNKKETEKGSFLIELLLAFAIISISMTVIIDAFVSSQHSYYSTSNKADLTSVMAFVFEDMTREARVSEGYTCDTAPACTGVNNLEMTHIEDLNDAVAGEVRTYRLSGGKIIKNDGADHDMTPASVVIDTFSVSVVDTPNGSPVRARVSLEAHSDEQPDQIINLQTSFTARRY